MESRNKGQTHELTNEQTNQPTNQLDYKVT